MTDSDFDYSFPVGILKFQLKIQIIADSNFKLSFSVALSFAEPGTNLRRRNQNKTKPNRTKQNKQEPHALIRCIVDTVVPHADAYTTTSTHPVRWQSCPPSCFVRFRHHHPQPEQDSNNCTRISSASRFQCRHLESDCILLTVLLSSSSSCFHMNTTLLHNHVKRRKIRSAVEILPSHATERSKTSNGMMMVTERLKKSNPRSDGVAEGVRKEQCPYHEGDANG